MRGSIDIVSDHFQKIRIVVKSVLMCDNKINVILEHDDSPPSKKLKEISKISEDLWDENLDQEYEVVILASDSDGSNKPFAVIKDKSLWVVQVDHLDRYQGTKNFESLFNQEFQAEIPKDLARPQKILRKIDIGKLWTSIDENNMGSLLEYLTPSPYVKYQCDGDEILTGFCGYGVNSYAFYWCTKIGLRIRMLRMPYGGIYSDMENDRSYILGNLEVLAEVDKKFGSHIVKEKMIDNMGDLGWEVTLNNGIIFFYGGRTTLRLYKEKEIIEMVDLNQVADYKHGHMIGIRAQILDILALGLKK